MNPVGFVLPAISLGLGTLMLRPSQRGFYWPQPQVSEFGPLPLKSILPQVTIEEIATTTLEITDHPVETGAAITDHSYMRPREVVIRCAWSNSPSSSGSLISQAVGFGAAVGGTVGRIGAGIASSVGSVDAAMDILSGNAVSQVKAVYDELLELQSARIPFDIITGKKSYKNMLFESLIQTTDKDWENALLIVARCKEVIIVSTQVVSLVPTDPNVQQAPQDTLPTTDYGDSPLVKDEDLGQDAIDSETSFV